MVFHNYVFVTLDKTFYDVSPKAQASYKEAFLQVLKNEKKVIIYSYATLGLKSDTTVLFWLQGNTLDEIQLFLNELMHTQLGRYLQITHTLFGMTRQTQYSSSSKKHLQTKRKGEKYLVIYPFTKTKEWYMLDFETRRKLMGGHVMIGKKYPQIEQLLLYSYGIDDQEFIVSYEMEDLSLFQSLIIELRSDTVRAYTQKDTPIFTCVYKSLEAIIDFL